MSQQGFKDATRNKREMDGGIVVRTDPGRSKRVFLREETAHVEIFYFADTAFSSRFLGTEDLVGIETRRPDSLGLITSLQGSRVGP